jgi:hypothetical protein
MGSRDAGDEWGDGYGLEEEALRALLRLLLRVNGGFSGRRARSERRL